MFKRVVFRQFDQIFDDPPGHLKTAGAFVQPKHPLVFGLSLFLFPITPEFGAIRKVPIPQRLDEFIPAARNWKGARNPILVIVTVVGKVANSQQTFRPQLEKQILQAIPGDPAGFRHLFGAEVYPIGKQVLEQVLLNKTLEQWPSVRSEVFAKQTRKPGGLQPSWKTEISFVRQSSCLTRFAKVIRPLPGVPPPVLRFLRPYRESPLPRWSWL